MIKLWNSLARVLHLRLSLFPTNLLGQIDYKLFHLISTFFSFFFLFWCNQGYSRFIGPKTNLFQTKSVKIKDPPNKYAFGKSNLCSIDRDCNRLGLGPRCKIKMGLEKVWALGSQSFPSSPPKYPNKLDNAILVIKNRGRIYENIKLSKITN